MKFFIESINIFNFRQYLGEIDFDFIYNKSKNVSIILGNNGSGKSNLLNAINWCFFGDEIHLSDDQNSKGEVPILNTTIAKSLNYGESSEVKVTIYLDIDNEKYSVTRSEVFTKNNYGKLISNQDQLYIRRPSGNEHVIEKGAFANYFINKLLPKDLRKFFFIDGEQLRTFFNISTSQNISEAIDQVSQLDLFYYAHENIEFLESYLRKKEKNTTPKLAEVQKKINDLIERKNRSKEGLDIQSKILNDNQDFLKKVNITLESKKQIKELQEKRKITEKEISIIKTKIIDKTKRRNEYLVDIAPLIYLKNDFIKLLDIFNDKIEKGELPPKIKDSFIREIIEKGTCICGNSINATSIARLQEYQEKLSLSELSGVTIEGKTIINEIIEEINSFPQEIDYKNNEIEILINDKKEKDAILSEISKEIKTDGDEDIINLECRRDELISIIGKSQAKIDEANKIIEEFDINLERLRKEESDELAKSDKNLEIKQKLNLTSKTIESLKLIESNVKCSIRKEVEKRTKTNFSTLIRKKDAFKDIIIDDNYQLRVINQDDYNVLKYLSAGEYLILGLAFMSALMKISGFHAPVIIDTPLGKIDKEHRENISIELPKFLENTQLILLVTPTEYDESVKKNISHYLLEKNYYAIMENEAKNQSKVLNS